MNQRCKHKDCFDDISCTLGEPNKQDCKFWSEPQDSDAASEVALTTSKSDLPWNGYSLGTSDLSILGGRGPAIVIGLIGPPESGKTSLLAFLYMWLLKYGRLDNWQFAGSWTLGGWESIVSNCRWTDQPPPSFPPHTTSSAGRYPGMLHLAFRDPAGKLRDIILTDAPGEWFVKWARCPTDHSLQGARWVFSHADALLLLIDSAALADRHKLAATRRATRDLVEMVGAHNSHLSLSTVWAKADVEVPKELKETIQKACEAFMPHSNTLKTTIQTPETIAACFIDILSRIDSRRSQPTISEPILSRDPFLAFRGSYASS